VDNIKMDLREIGWGGMYWIDLAQDRNPVEGSCEHGNEPSGFIKVGKFLSSCIAGGFSKRSRLHGVN
jgi:hypothetical protein